MAFQIQKSRATTIMSCRRQDVLDTIDQCTNGEIKFDDVKQARIAEREGRRRRRRELRSKLGKNLHCEGLSSDDELLQSADIELQSEKGTYMKG